MSRCRLRLAHRGDTGTVSGFIVVVAAALVICAGLVYDGGRIVAARVRAADVAENAARAGAQQTDLRGGVITIDPRPAGTTADAFMVSQGARGRVVATRTEVTVHASITVDMTLLSIIGIGSRTVSATRSSSGVTE